MSTESEKLKRFSKAVYSEADKQAEEIISSANSTHDSEIQNSSDSSLASAYVVIKDDIKNIQNKYKKSVASQEINSKRAILNHREQLAKQVFQNVIKKLKNFKNSDDYLTFLQKNLKQIILENPEKAGVVYLAPVDFKYLNKLIEITGDSYTFEEKRTIKLGGLSVYYPKDNILCDNTIDSLLEEQVDLFHKKADFKLQ